MSHDTESTTLLGFWVYLLTDFVMFATLFATYIVLHNGTYGGPTAQDLFNPTCALLPTLILLGGSFASGLGGIAVQRNRKKPALIFFSLTFLAGLLFLGLQLDGWSHIIAAGYTWKTSAFLSAFFTLEGTFAIHIILALLWTLVFLIPIIRFGLSPTNNRRLLCLKMFWQFLNVVWLFLFSIVYLLR